MRRLGTLTALCVLVTVIATTPAVGRVLRSPVAHSAGKPTPTTGTANNVGPSSAQLTGTVNPGDKPTNYWFEFGVTNAYGKQTAYGSLPKSKQVQAVSATSSGLAASTTYHYRLVTANADGTVAGADRVFTTSDAPASPGASPAPEDPAPAEPTQPEPTDDSPQPSPSLESPAPAPVALPSFGQTAIAGVTAGTVLVRRPGSAGYETLGSSTSIPVGSIIDARAGAVALLVARAPGASNQAATLGGGKFAIRQTRAHGGMTDISLRGGDFSRCTDRRVPSGVASAASRRVIRKLWSKDHHGRFQTRGRGSVATVRGTTWTTVDRCDGTLTRVASGKVLVRERATGRTKLVTRGHSFLARPPR
jgi:hypothetical protein